MCPNNRLEILDTINAQIMADSTEEVYFQAYSGLECRTDWWSLQDVVEYNSHRDFILYREGTSNYGRWTLAEAPE